MRVSIASNRAHLRINFEQQIYTAYFINAANDYTFSLSYAANAN